MKKTVLIIIIIFCSYGCSKEEVKFNDLINIKESRDFIVNDAFDTVVYILTFNNEANITLIDAKAEITNGVFVDNDKKELTIEPIRNTKDVIGAIIEVRSTTSPKPMEVIFNINEYRTRYIVSPVKSIPAKIGIQASAFNVNNSFESEVSITGSVLSDIGEKASDGYQVIINDTFEDGTPVNGAFRSEALTTNNGQISFVYSPGQVASDQFIKLEAIVLDDNGLETEISDEVKLYITNND